MQVKIKMKNIKINGCCRWEKSRKMPENLAEFSSKGPTMFTTVPDEQGIIDLFSAYITWPVFFFFFLLPFA